MRGTIPAVVSRPIGASLGYLVASIGEPDVGLPTLLKALRGLLDPRDRRGGHHSVGVIVAVAVCAIAAGAKSYWAISEWVKRADPEQQGSLVDNALIESFWSTMQRELLDRSAWNSRIELASAMFEWIEGFYNPTRRHSLLGKLSPTDYENIHASAETAAY